MGALECALEMSKEEVMNRIAALNLPDYGLSRQTLCERIENAKRECLEEQKETGVIAALNNADTEGVLLEVLKKNPEKVLEGIKILAYAMGTENKMLVVPEYAAEIVEQDNIKELAVKNGVRISTEFLDVRKYKGSVVIHIVTAANLTDALDGNYEPCIYVSVNGGKLEGKKYGTKISEIVNTEGAKVIQTGYHYILPEDMEQVVEDAGIDNGVIRVLTESDCIVSEVTKQLTESRKQSCGKCVFCREGLLQLHYMHKEITEGRGKLDFLDLTKEIGETMAYSTCCTMGEVSANGALSAIKILLSEYEAHIKKKKCPAEVCFSSEAVYIDPKTCTGCGDCMDVCPKDCIEGKANYIHMIDDMECDKCGKCVQACEAGAVIKTSGKIPKLPNRLTKVGRFKKR